MRIVDRETFLAMPPGTIFAKFGGPDGDPTDAWFGEVCIKEDTCGADFVVQDLLGQFEGWTGEESHFREIGRMLDSSQYESPPIDYDSAGRDGLFDQKQRFAVFSEEDARRLLARLASAIEARRAATAQTDAVHESAVPQGDAENTDPTTPPEPLTERWD